MTQGYTPWPLTTAPLLEFLEVRRGEGAPRTVFFCLLAALRFFEEAGEVPRGQRLSDDPAFDNAAKEASLKLAGEQGAGRGQAPRLPLAFLDLLEEVVDDESRPPLQRGDRLVQAAPTLALAQVGRQSRTATPHTGDARQRLGGTASAHQYLRTWEDHPGTSHFCFPGVLAHTPLSPDRLRPVDKDRPPHRPGPLPPPPRHCSPGCDPAASTLVRQRGFLASAVGQPLGQGRRGSLAPLCWPVLV